jgi:hypothetical protein
MPQTWRGTYNGDKEYVTELRREWDTRQRLEEKYPELAGDRRPILAHEGPYQKVPLRAGDEPPTSGNAGHPHPHSHAGGSHAGHGHGAHDPGPSPGS